MALAACKVESSTSKNCTTYRTFADIFVLYKVQSGRRFWKGLNRLERYGLVSNSEENTERAQNGKDNYEWVENAYLHNSMIRIGVAFIVISLIFWVFYALANIPLKDVLILFVIYIAIYWPIILYVVSKEPRYIAISEDGVHFRYRKGDEKHIWWEEIKEVSFVYDNRFAGRTIIHKDGKETNLGFVNYELAREIQKRHREYVSKER